jgi:large subunit ribosomal protein L4e
MNKNHRQPYAVSKLAGEQTSAQSWGTGRAVSRIPRVAGGGTHRSGQGAFGNMCRGGRMFGATKVWRRWHVKISNGQRRYATCSALSASSLAPLVLARGHRIEQIAEVPLVIADVDVDAVAKTKEAIALLKSIGAYADLDRVAASRHLRAGKGKARNRRYVQRRGPLLIHNKERGNDALASAFRNVQGLDLCNVHHLNLLQLAPGGHVGRFVIWTESAFKELDNIFGTKKQDSQHKSGFRVPSGILTNADIGRIINSDEVQTAIRPANVSRTFRPRQRNPLVNAGAMIKLNPFAQTKKIRSLEANKRSAAKRNAKVQKNREFVKQLHAPSVAPIRGENEYAPF